MDLRERAAALLPDLIALRRDLHAVPELGLRLPRTQQLVLAALDGLPLEVTLGRALDSVTAVLRGAGTGPTVLLRGDMDALPVAERPQPGGPVSSIPGQMHACGHDLHTAILVGAARMLCERRAELPGDVVFMFQPAEEDPGGARLMVEEGVLTAAGADRPVAAAYALHVFSGLLPSGQVGVLPGTMMAAADQLRVVIRGRGAHGSAPHTGLDPIQAACAAVTALQTAVTRSFSAFDPVVVTVGTFHAGEAANVIPEEARFTATVRTFSPAVQERAKAVLPQVVHGVAAAHGLTADVDYHQGYPVTANHPAHAARVAETVRAVLGADRLAALDHPSAGAEDFSYVLREVPGAYFFLGALLPGRDLATAPSNHSPDAAFDEAVIADGAALLAALALSPLD